MDERRATKVLLTPRPSHRVGSSELNSTTPTAHRRDLVEDTVHRPRYCGEGSFDLTGMITASRAAGWTGPWGVESLSEGRRSMPGTQALGRATGSARRNSTTRAEHANTKPMPAGFAQQGAAVRGLKASPLRI
jgi:hypothetical protein